MTLVVHLGKYSTFQKLPERFIWYLMDNYARKHIRKMSNAR